MLRDMRTQRPIIVFDTDCVFCSAMVAFVLVLSVVAYGNTRFREAAEPALIVGSVAGIALTFARRTSLTEQR